MNKIFTYTDNGVEEHVDLSKICKVSVVKNATHNLDITSLSYVFANGFLYSIMDMREASRFLRTWQEYTNQDRKIVIEHITD